jgi:hypothetical protein
MTDKMDHCPFVFPSQIASAFRGQGQRPGSGNGTHAIWTRETHPLPSPPFATSTQVASPFRGQGQRPLVDGGGHGGCELCSEVGSGAKGEGVREEKGGRRRRRGADRVKRVRGGREGGRRGEHGGCELCSEGGSGAKGEGVREEKGGRKIACPDALFLASSWLPRGFFLASSQLPPGFLMASFHFFPFALCRSMTPCS